MEDSVLDGSCECCWDFNQINVPGAFQPGYDMNMCGECLKRSEGYEE